MVRIAGICRDLNWPEGLRGEVIEEIEYQQRTYERTYGRERELVIGHFFSLGLLAGATVLILAVPEALVAWLISGFALYSFNFIILFLPTTRKGQRDESCRRAVGREAIEPLMFLLRRRKTLAVEVGLTMFLGGMVPLALSFMVIFGLGLLLTLYLAFVQGQLALDLAWPVIIQAVIIMVFFLVMVLTKPQAQGFTRIARSLRGRYAQAKERQRYARLSRTAVLLAMGLVMTGLGALFVGAILLTGGVLGLVIGAGGRLGLSLFLLFTVLVMQVLVMRHFQSYSSRRMARSLLRERMEVLRAHVLEPLTAILEQGRFADKEAFDKEEFERIKYNFFNVAIYEVFELNFFGFSSVFVVGPNVKYLIDERALPYMGVGMANGSGPLAQETKGY